MTARGASPKATIRASDLGLVLAAAMMRRHTRGRTAQFCALTAGPLIEVDCHIGRASGYLLREAMHLGISPARVMPMNRGYIARVFDDVSLRRGRREVLKTWGVGIHALRAEPAYTLNGGSDA